MKHKQLSIFKKEAIKLFHQKINFYKLCAARTDEDKFQEIKIAVPEVHA